YAAASATGQAAVVGDLNDADTGQHELARCSPLLSVPTAGGGVVVDGVNVDHVPGGKVRRAPGDDLDGEVPQLLVLVGGDGILGQQFARADRARHPRALRDRFRSRQISLRVLTAREADAL